MGFKKVAAVIVAVLFITISAYTADREPLRAGQMHVACLDVGQGDAILIVTPSGKTILIDGGERDKSTKVLFPYFRKNNIKKLDYVILTHGHSDHLGGLVDIVETMDIGQVYESVPAETQTYKKFKKAIDARKIPYKQLWRGDKVDFGDGISADVLHPPKGGFIVPLDDSTPFNKPGTLDSNLNNQSLVFKLNYGKKSFFFSGDMEVQVDEDLLKNSAPVHTDIYKAGHHGSQTSSSASLLKAMSPDLTLISVGLDNQFKHPHQVTLDKLKYFKMKYFRTDYDGQIDIWTDGDKIVTACESAPIDFVDKPQVVFNKFGFISFHFKVSKNADVKVQFGDSKATLKTIKNAPFGKKEFNLTVKKNIGTQYYYKIVAAYVNDDQQTIEYSGSLTVPADAPGTDVGTSKVTMKPEKPYINQKTDLSFSAKAASAGGKYRFSFYADAISPDCLIGKVDKDLAAQTAVEVLLNDWRPTENRIYECYITVEKAGKLVKVITTKASIFEKKLFVDATKRNKFTEKDEMVNMFVDITNRGGYRGIISHALSKEELRDAKVLIITDPLNGYSSTELDVVKNFVVSGGGLILATEADYYDAGNSLEINKLLEFMGSNIRVNDDEVVDEVSNAGIPYVPVANVFPSPVVYPEVKKIVCKSTASLVNKNLGPLSRNDGVEIFAFAASTATNIDADEKGDAYIYKTGEDIPLVAGEAIGNGKIAVYGSSAMFTFHVYNDSKVHQSNIFNLSILDWMTGSASDIDVTEAIRGLRNISVENKSGDESGRIFRKLRYSSVLENSIFDDVKAGEYDSLEDLVQDLKHCSNDERLAFRIMLQKARNQLIGLSMVEDGDERRLRNLISEINSIIR